MTLSELQKVYWDKLAKVYDEREAKAITKIVFENILALESHKLFLERFRILTASQIQQLQDILSRLLTHEPVQYILEEADFGGLRFRVNKHVLIPRPETEELVEWVAHSLATRLLPPTILDIGTGSGCIPVLLAKKIPLAKIEAIDVSEEALKVGEENNRFHQTNVGFSKLDILNGKIPSPVYDVIVSNPPYISQKERASLKTNVLQFEPHLALFAPGEDDLIFYRKISEQAMHGLKPGGSLFFEIHEAKGKEVAELLRSFGFTSVELRKDISGKERMIKGAKP